MEMYLTLIEKEDQTSPFASMLLLEFMASHMEIEGKLVSFVGNLLKKIGRAGCYQSRLEGVVNDLIPVSQENPSLRSLLEKFCFL